MRIHPLSAIAFAAVITLTGCARESANTVKIALACPLTGDQAAMGQGMKRGLEMALAEANRTKRFGDRVIELAAFDDRADPKEAVTVANQILMDRKILGVVGHLNSGCSIPASQVYARRNLVMITPASTNPKLTQQGLKNIFRICATDDAQGAYAAEFFRQKKGLRRVAIIQDKTAYGLGLAENFRWRFLELQGEITGFDGIDYGDKDFKALLTRIKAENPEALYFGGIYTEGGLIAKQAKELGLNVPLIGGDGLSSPDYVTIAGQASEGDYATMMGAPISELPQAKDFAAQYADLYPGVAMQPYDAYTYDAANILLAASQAADWDPGKVAEKMPAVQHDGLVGKTVFDGNGDTLNKTITLYQVQQGKFVPVK